MPQNYVLVQANFGLVKTLAGKPSSKARAPKTFSLAANNIPQEMINAGEKTYEQINNHITSMSKDNRYKDLDIVGIQTALQKWLAKKPKATAPAAPRSNAPGASSADNPPMAGSSGDRPLMLSDLKQYHEMQQQKRPLALEDTAEQMAELKAARVAYQHAGKYKELLGNCKNVRSYCQPKICIFCSSSILIDSLPPLRNADFQLLIHLF